jgi:hypothetical protein
MRWADSDGKLSIGKFCSIASGVKILLGGEHRIDWVTTYPFSALTAAWPTGNQIFGLPASKGDVVIGNDVWIGTDATIMSGVKIGNGAVIGAGAVVASDVPDYGIVLGNPARVTRKRFSDDVILRLLRLKWWDWPDRTIREAVPLLCSNNVELFLNKYENVASDANRDGEARQSRDHRTLFWRIGLPGRFGARNPTTE